jgi:hydrogenase large subunit
MTTLATPNGFTLDTGGKRLVIDPVTRIEGHMRCEVNIDSNNMIRNAVSTGTMWRGLEVILKGATRAMPGPSSSGSAACAPAPTP